MQSIQKNLEVLIANMLVIKILNFFQIIDIQFKNIQIINQMKKLCNWLCPKMKRNTGPYDVQQQTFYMQENFGQIQQPQKLTDPSARISNQSQNQKQQSNESLSSNPSKAGKSEQLQMNQKQFSQNKNKIQKQDKEELKVQQQQQKQAVKQNTPQAQIQKKQQQVQKKVEEVPKPNPHILTSSFKKKAYNPDDYRFLKQQGQFRVKGLDSLKGQQFNVDGCKNGTYFIFDITGTIYIDDCESCFVFFAPCQASVFIRNCKDMVLVGATTQFRTYNTHNCYFSIYCKSQPVIQSSSNVHFSPLHCPEYPQLKKQFKKANLQIWNDNWSVIHNFTKKQGEVDHSLQKSPSYQMKVDWQKAFEMANLQMTKQKQQIIPFIQGSYPMQQQPNKTLIVFSKQASQKDDEIYSWVSKNNIHLLNASKRKIGAQKYLTTSLLINDKGQLQLDLSQIGECTITKDQDKIEELEPKYFVVFKDER